jgi:alpha-beta hydrolase superfamily lysophospholipase
VVLWGHSQGGQAVLFAAERSAEYAPELQVLGVAVAAPAADLNTLLTDHINDISGVTIGSYAFEAYSQVYAGRGATLEGILTPAARQLLPEMNELWVASNSVVYGSAGGRVAVNVATVTV